MASVTRNISERGILTHVSLDWLASQYEYVQIEKVYDKNAKERGSIGRIRVTVSLHDGVTVDAEDEDITEAVRLALDAVAAAHAKSAQEATGQLKRWEKKETSR